MLVLAVFGLVWQGLLAMQANQHAAGRSEESGSLDEVSSAHTRAARTAVVVIIARGGGWSSACSLAWKSCGLVGLCGRLLGRGD